MTKTPLYAPRVVATSVLLLGLGAVLGIAMLRTTLGPFSFGVSAGVTPAWRVALWTTGTAAERAHSTRRWRARLEERFALRSLDRAGLAQVGSDEIDFLIVDGVALGATEATRLRSFVEAGGRLALYGSGDADNPEHAMALSKFVGEGIAPARDYRWTLLPARPGPLAAGFSPRAGLPLRRAHNVYALRRPAADAEVVWARAADASASPLSPSAQQGAVWRRRLGSGRLVWWSVRPDVALDRVDAQATMTRMVRASTAWLLEEPFAELAETQPGDPAVLEAIAVRVARRSNKRFLLSISNPAAAESPPLELRVFLNRRVAEVLVELTAVRIGPGGIEQPVFELAANRSELALHTPPVGPGESRSYYLDLLEAKPSR